MPLIAPIARSVVKSLASSITGYLYEGISALPDTQNLLGAWYATDYTANPVPMIPKSGATVPTSAPINPAPRRLFSNAAYYGPGSCTLTDDAATANDGSSEASTLVSSAGAWFMRVGTSATIPAGTYTIAMHAKRNTGTDQAFAFTKDATATRSAVKTATSSWQRFSYTFTLGATTSMNEICVCSSDGATQANLQICDLEIYAGSSDLGPSTLAAHLYLGANAYQAPTVSGGEIDLSGGKYGLIQLAASQTTTNITMMAVVSKTAAGSNYNAFLSKVQDYTGATGIVQDNGTPHSYIGGTGTAYSQLSTMWSIINQGYHAITHRYDGTNLSMWLDDIQMFSVAATISSYAIRDFFVGLVNTTSLHSGCKIANIALWKSALSDANVRSAVSYLRNKATLSGLTMADARVFCAEGDSISANSGATPWLTGAVTSPKTLGRNFAVAGSTLSGGAPSLANRATTVDAVLPQSIGSRKFILSVLIGANDIGSTSDMTAYAASIASYCDARRAAGWKVVICTVTPKALSAGGASDTTFNTRRASLNAILRTWVGSHADAVADFAADATVGVDAAASNTTYYSDGLHPTAACYAILEPILTAAINSI